MQWELDRRQDGWPSMKLVLGSGYIKSTVNQQYHQGQVAVD